MRLKLLFVAALLLQFSFSHRLWAQSEADLNEDGVVDVADVITAATLIESDPTSTGLLTLLGVPPSAGY